jgi:hypothetical protein
MQDLKNKLYKIGISIRPFYREKTLQSESPNIILIYTKEFSTQSEASKIENMLHNKYSKNRVRGEWFSLLLSEVSEIKSLFL